MSRARAERVVDLALIALLVLIAAPILYVGLHPLFASRYPRVGKIDLRVPVASRASVPRSLAAAGE